MRDIDELIKALTLEEKAALCSGLDNWHTKGVERLGIPSVMVSDGPHGLRKQEARGDNLGVSGSNTAICYPAACATAASFDKQLLLRLGQTLGRTCRAENVSILLGPAINIKRTPLCGRNFEYFSEDPCLTGELAASYVTGVQSQGVGTSVKHFAANNQETRRMTCSAQIDEKTLREIYLAPFETVVKKAEPKTMMCAYNGINGVQAAENPRLLTEILRGDWGFKGYVMSDWGAVSDRVQALKAGLDLEMPYSGGESDAMVAAAVRSGELSEAALDTAVRRILSVVFDYADNASPASYSLAEDHAAAVDMAKECIVLLKNEKAVLPLDKKEKVVFIGEFAKKPRFQGGGSSHINAYSVEGAYERALGYSDVSYCRGYSLSDESENEALLLEAAEAARTHDKAVVFIGLPDNYESEGFDRKHMRLPDAHNRLMQEVIKANPAAVAVLHNGSPVELPWAAQAAGIVEAYLGGEGVGSAVADILYGEANPCGRLAESFPYRLEDNPSYLNFPGENDRVVYGEGVYVGYRYYDKKKMPVLFPFGYGLGYSEFIYGGLSADKKTYAKNEDVIVSVSVKNNGQRDGKEVVQLYISGPEGAFGPVKQLKAFEKVFVKAGETAVVNMTLPRGAFAAFDKAAGAFRVKGGVYGILACKSAAEVAVSAQVELEGDEDVLFVDRGTTVGQLLDCEATRGEMERFLAEFMARLAKDKPKTDKPGTMMGVDREMLRAMARDIPVRGLKNLTGLSSVDALIEKFNALIKAWAR